MLLWTSSLRLAIASCRRCRSSHLDATRLERTKSTRCYLSRQYSEGLRANSHDDDTSNPWPFFQEQDGSTREKVVDSARSAAPQLASVQVSVQPQHGLKSRQNGMRVPGRPRWWKQRALVKIRYTHPTPFRQAQHTASRRDGKKMPARPRLARRIALVKIRHHLYTPFQHTQNTTSRRKWRWQAMGAVRERTNITRPTSLRLAKEVYPPAGPEFAMKVWVKQWFKLHWEQRKVPRVEWEQLPWLPMMDVRTLGWVETVLAKLDTGEDRLDHYDLSLADDKDSTQVWTQVAMWLLAYDPKSMPRFLEATHVEPYHVSASLIELCLTRLVQYWKHLDEPDTEQQLQRLADVFCVLCDRGDAEPLQTSRPTIRFLIPHCTKEQVFRMYKAIRLHNVKMHWYTHLHFTTYFARQGHFEEALAALMEAKAAGAEINTYAFRSNCATLLRKTSEQREGLRLCLRLVSDLVDMGVELNNIMCNVIMLNAVEAGDLKTAFDLYHSLLDKGLEPTGATFGVLLKGCKMNIDDVVTLNEVVRDAIQRGHVRKRERLASTILHCLTLHHSKHHPSTAIATLTEAYAQLFDLRPLQQLQLPIPQISQEGQTLMPPSQHALNIMIGTCIRHALTNQPYTEGLLPLYERWRNAVEAGDPYLTNLATNDYTANMFLLAFIRRPDGLAYAVRVLRDMRAPLPTSTGAQQSRPTRQTWSILLHGFALHGKMRLAEDILSLMHHENTEPDVVTWTSLLNGYARAQDEQGALGVVRRAQARGVVWDAWAYGGVKKLKRRRKLTKAMELARLSRQLDFSDELKEGLSERLSGADREDDFRETAL